MSLAEVIEAVSREFDKTVRVIFLCNLYWALIARLEQMKKVEAMYWGTL